VVLPFKPVVVVVIFSDAWSWFSGEKARLPVRFPTDSGSAELCAELVDVCRHNQAVTTTVRPDRPDLARFWSMVEIMVARKRVQNAADSDNVWWHSGAIESSFRQLARAGDVEVLAFASCVLDASGVSVPAHVKAARDAHRLAYAGILHRFGLRKRMTELLQWNSALSAAEEASVVIDNVCANCGSFLVQRSGHGGRGVSVCRSCNERAFRCSICHLYGKGISIFCLHCGHGGCFKHLSSWFADVSPVCPTGCGCECKFNHGQLTRESLLE
jgi:RING/Ubox like zinc-binding domain